MAKDKPAQIRETENGREKWCPKGKHYVKADEDHFYHDDRSKTELSSWCKECQRKNVKSASKKPAVTPNTSEKKEPKKEMILELDFSEHGRRYKDLLSAAKEKLRTPEMQAIWLISESLYKERA